MKRIYLCDICNRYTLKKKCSECGKDTVSPKPPKWSPEDRYGEYRRRAKEELLYEG